MSGIDKILPGMKIDDYLFDPCGYSMNAIKEAGMETTRDIGSVKVLATYM